MFLEAGGDCRTDRATALLRHRSCQLVRTGPLANVKFHWLNGRRHLMGAVVVSKLQFCDDPVEIVERKGLGHPDTICDALAENLSRALCREYRRRFGAILHHNVDKALLCGGRAAPAFGGGAILAPIRVHLAGRAVCQAASEHVPIAEIAVECAREWLRTNMHALDADRHVQVHAGIQPGSIDLQALFSAAGHSRGAPANDTSVGVGHAPLSRLEGLVLAVEKRINTRDRVAQNPAWGEDVKVMGVRHVETVNLTIACAMIGQHLAHIDEYLGAKDAVVELVHQLAIEHGFETCEIVVNAADRPAAGSVYLTVTGTSAEAGDDGQVGRGNRVNGLITPCRPMSLEAAAGKNPVSHVGKIYNVVAGEIARSVVAASSEILRAECLMVSKIGAPVTDPAIVQVKIATVDGIPASQLKERTKEIVAERLGNIPRLIDEFVAGRIAIF
jgi:S-adenosylmethionine synthetase